VWDLGSGRELRTLTDHTKVVNPWGEPDGRYAVSGVRPYLKVWEMVAAHATHPQPAHASALSWR